MTATDQLRRIVRAEIEKFARQRSRRTVRVHCFAETRTHGSPRGTQQLPAPQAIDQAQAIRQGPRPPAKNSPRGGVVYNFASGPKLPDTIEVPLTLKLDANLDPEERQEIIDRLLELGFDPAELGQVKSDQDLVGIQHAAFNAAGKGEPPMLRARKEKMLRASEPNRGKPYVKKFDVPAGKTAVRDGLAYDGYDVSSMASVDNRPVPQEAAVVDNDNRPVPLPGTEPRARKFSELPLPRGGMSERRRQQLLGCTDAGKAVLQRQNAR